MKIVNNNLPKDQIAIAKTSVEIVSSLIRKDFDKSHDSDRCRDLIETARHFGLLKLADQMEKDYKFEFNF